MIDVNKVYVNRTFSCGAEELFHWLTTPTLIMQWFGPQGFKVSEAENDLCNGGRYSFVLNSEKASFTIFGEYTEIIKPKSIVFTYRYAGLASPPPPSIVKISLTENSDSSTSMRFVQEFETESKDMEKRTVAWNFMFTILEKLVVH